MTKKTKVEDLLEVLGVGLAEAIEESRYEELLLPTLKALNKSSPKKKLAKEFRKYYKGLVRINKKAKGGNKKGGYGIRPMHISKLLAMPMPGSKWLVESLVPDGCVTVLSGDPRSFKTWIILHLSKQIAVGGLFFGKFNTAKKKVLVVEEDDKPRTIRDRAKLLGYDKKDEVYFLINTSYKVEKTMGQTVAYVKQHKIGVVIFDCLLRVYDGDENSSREVANFFMEVQRLTNIGVTVIVLHHHRKSQFGQSDSSPLRGSSDILAAVDCHLKVERKSKRRIRIVQTKVRVEEEVAPFGIDVVPDGQEGVKFAFTEFESMEEEWTSKAEVAEEKILEILADGIPLGRQDLVLTLKQYNVGQSVAGSAIKNLANKKLIKIEAGAKGKMTISLAE